MHLLTCNGFLQVIQFDKINSKSMFRFQQLSIPASLLAHFLQMRRNT